MTNRVLGVAVLPAAFSVLLFSQVSAAPAPAQFAEWQQSGSLYILTTPDGAGLPATARNNFNGSGSLSCSAAFAS